MLEEPFQFVVLDGGCSQLVEGEDLAEFVCSDNPSGFDQLLIYYEHLDFSGGRQDVFSFVSVPQELYGLQIGVFLLPVLKLSSFLYINHGVTDSGHFVFFFVVFLTGGHGHRHAHISICLLHARITAKCLY